MKPDYRIDFEFNLIGEDTPPRVGLCQKCSYTFRFVSEYYPFCPLCGVRVKRVGRLEPGIAQCKQCGGAPCYCDEIKKRR